MGKKLKAQEHIILQKDQTWKNQVNLVKEGKEEIMNS